MATKKGNRYTCPICGDDSFDQALDADLHMLNHDLIYFPITKEELNELVHFIYFNINFHPKNESNISQDLVKRMQTYLKNAVKKDMLEDE